MLLNFSLKQNKTTLNSLSDINYNFVDSFKNLNVFNQAFSKVFKSTIEEERSAVTFSLYSKYFQPQIFISEKPVNLFNNLNKNINFFVQPIVFKSNLI